MNCPMTFNTPDQRGISPCTCDCNCAWWVTGRDGGYCAITSIALSLQDINTTLDNIEKDLSQMRNY